MDEKHKYFVILKVTLIIILMVGVLTGAKELFTFDSKEENSAPAVSLTDPTEVVPVVEENFAEEPTPEPESEEESQELIDEELTAAIIDESSFNEERSRGGGGGSSTSSSSNDEPATDPDPNPDPDPTYDVGRSITLVSGNTYSVTLAINVQDHDYLIIDETLPSGSTVVDAGSGVTQTTGRLKWALGSIISEPIPSSLTYQIEFSGDTTFSGEYATDLIDPTSIEGDLSV